VPIGGTIYCQFHDATGPLRALVLPSASQVRERYAQAMAFMRQQASSDSTRHQLCHSVSIGPPSAEVDGLICSHNAVLGERPLNDKCPKIAKSQSTNQVGEIITEGTNTHCVDRPSHADSVDRPKPIVQATDNPDRCNVCPCCDPDTRDGLVSLSQSTEVTVAESDKDAINPRVDLLPVAINNLQPVRRFQYGRLDAIQSRTLIGRKSARTCAERQVNSVFVYGARARVIVRTESSLLAGDRRSASFRVKTDCKARDCGSLHLVADGMSRSVPDASTASGAVPPSASGGDGGSGTDVTVPYVYPHAGTRGFHEPQVPFPHQKCSACSSDEVFRTRTSLTNHLKKHGLMWKKNGSYAQLRRSTGGGSPTAQVERPVPPPLMGMDIPAATGVVPPRPALVPAALPESVAVTSVTAFPQYPGPRPLLLHSGSEPHSGAAGATHAPAAGRPSSLPTHDYGPRPVVPVSEGGPVSAGDWGFPLVRVRRAPAVTTTSAGVGRGTLLRDTLQRDLARRRMASAPGCVGFLLEAPWEEGVAASLPPPLLQVPHVPPEWDVALPVAAEEPAPSADMEVPPPVALAELAAPGHAVEDVPPAQPRDHFPSGAVAPEIPATEAQPDAAWGDQAGSGDDPLASSSAGMAQWAKPTLTYGHMASALRPHWKESYRQAVALAEDLFASTDTTLIREDVILGVECMFAQRKDMALCLHGWLRDRSGPEHDPRAVFDELLNLPSTLKDTE